MKHVLAAMVCLPLAGCIGHMLSPPARVLPLETAATVDEGETRLALEGSATGVVFGPSIASGTARVRHGTSEGTEVNGELTGTYVIETPSGAESETLAASGRAGIKHELFDHLAVTAGLGGGVHAGGGFLAPDVGLILAYENPYIVPFVSARATISVPIAPSPVDVSDGNESTLYEEAPRTFIVAGAVGARVPVSESTSISGGVGLTVLTTDEHSGTGLTAGVGVDFRP